VTTADDHGGASLSGGTTEGDAAMEGFDAQEMVQRFAERAEAVRHRQLPPVGLEDRQRFIDQAQVDFQDFAMIGDAEATLEDGVLVLRIDLRSPEARHDGTP
jgi:hypothetical protein